MSERYIAETDIDALDILLRQKMRPERYAHTQRVLEMALKMGEIFGEDAEKIRLAALFHDFCKKESPGNELSHAGDAADLLAREYGVTNEDVLNAVRYHTTGRAGMSRLELIIFLADTLEPGRLYKGVDALRALAFTDLYGCAYAVMKELLVYLTENAYTPTQDNLDAALWLETRKETKI